MLIDKIALILLIIGGLNWGCIGIFGFNPIALLLGGSGSILSRIVYALTGLASVWYLSFLFRQESTESEEMQE